MGDNELLDIEVEDNLTTLIINNPPVNALSKELIAKLKTVFIDLNKQDTIKIIIITGGGRTFCAGADIKELAAIKTSKDGEAFAKNGQELMSAIERSAIPVIAAINGACVGGGNELAMACHIRIASENSWFSQPEINLGIIPGFGGTQRLPKLIGRSKAVELILTGDKITAKEALALGLVNKVVGLEKLMDQAKIIGGTIANKGKIATNTCLHAIYGIEREDKLFGKVCATEDKEEGIKAFLEKREAVFKDK
ncbi:MAG: enoyl-CoA hydratase/isomerase family protein [Deltaproteobacteria bacterium]|nr:enoyl-CoA hydratase/isomerase family protein [Deltaproteobacteria bacterium]MBI3755034.1 enoyl-CoA hydratase/isomerase family protein [Deltaproteobacteria bacterium]